MAGRAKNGLRDFSGRLLDKEQVFSVLLIALLFLALALRESWKDSCLGLGNTFAVGDWLINYGAGFVRRGLGGTILIPLAKAAGIRPVMAVLSLKAALYSALYAVALELLLVPDPGPALLAAALLASAASPVFLLFVDTGRKELVLFVCAAFLARRAAAGKQCVGTWILSLLFLLLTMLHEGLYFFLPAFLVFLSVAYPDEDWGWARCVSCLLPSTLFFFALVKAGPAGHEKVLGIIGAFGGDPKHWDAGELAYLERTPASGLLDVLRMLEKAKASDFFAVLSGALVWPIPAFLWLRSRIKDEYWGGLMSTRAGRLFLAALAFQIPLFCVAKDWSRWLTVDLMLAALGCLALHRRLKVVPAPPWHRSGDDPEGALPWRWFLGVAFFYVGAWTFLQCRIQNLSMKDLYDSDAFRATVAVFSIVCLSAARSWRRARAGRNART